MLVDENDRIIGTEEKMKTHREGKLHRAFSIFIFSRKNDELQLLLQQRHPDKYHSGALWSNTCCSHPQPGEDIVIASQRRLYEEIGLKIPLQKVGKFRYTAPVDHLIENEYDHVLVGFRTNETIIHFNKNEISAVRWISIYDLERELKQHAEIFTPWLDLALKIALKNLKNVS
ncbi:isopentenyl-diphosphate Delta-isomerase [Coxiella endosymbiont of Amblyomma nuttalli]|uniref:isopentenyl-diphosphate Delta-isomerase n=1 Tax=Coxiella endosymbiont of Amblyomma nuttalli TaxID=2749996 RepID=UPI001FCFC6EF|nr:isopentenyl-diphosphate Delta-isomerase [Coxiella endosymbiont of Amblyomma nuttalli]